MQNEAMVLKPQDVYVALKIVAAQSGRAPYVQLAAELTMSPSEVHASVKRAQSCHLLHGPQRRNRPNFSALEEFLLHGLKYVFPPDRGELTRGIPTSYAAEPLRDLITQGDEPSPVWPYEEGSQRGLGLNRCTGPRRSRPCAIASFTSTWRSPTLFGTAARVSAALQT
jgi:hypothetical protein